MTAQKIVCKHCGSEFIQKSINHNYCSDECRSEVKKERDRERAKRPEIKQRNLQSVKKFYLENPNLRSEKYFENKYPNYVYSELSDLDKEILKLQHKSCKVFIIHCKECGIHKVVKFEHKHRNRVNYFCEKCIKGKRMIGWKHPFKNKFCGKCGKQFNGKGCAIYCSNCKDELKRIQKRTYRKFIGRDFKTRCKKLKLEYQHINVFKVFSRDKWRCQLCGIKTPKRLRGKNVFNSPELDHIIPLSKGGSHLPHNVQCLCRRCNNKKSNRMIGQLKLAI